MRSDLCSCVRLGEKPGSIVPVDEESIAIEYVCLAGWNINKAKMAEIKERREEEVGTSGVDVFDEKTGGMHLVKPIPLIPIQLANLGNSPNSKVRDDAKCPVHQKFAPTRLPQYPTHHKVDPTHHKVDHITPPSATLLSSTNEPANPPTPSQSPHAHSSWFVPQHPIPASATLLTPRKQNALFNSALRQSTSLRKDLDHFADTASPSPALQGQISASLTSFSRTIDDYAKLAKHEPVQTKQEKAFERVKSFRAELEEYRESFRRVKSVNEDMVRLRATFE